MHKFWLISGFQSPNEIDSRDLRLNVEDINYSNFVVIKENCAILCLRFSQAMSEEMISERLPNLNLTAEDSKYKLHSCQTVHTTPEQKNVHVCHIPPFLQDENKFLTFINYFTKKVQIINNSEYMTIRCQSSQNSSFLATYLRAIPEECLAYEPSSINSQTINFGNNAFESIEPTKGHKLTVELSIEQLPIALIFKVGKSIKDYETRFPVLADLKKEGLQFTLTKSHITSPTMQVIAVTAESLNDVYTIIDRVTEAGFTAKRFLSVPYQEELEKNEIIIENIPPEVSLSNIVQRLQTEFNARIYEARIISNLIVDPITQETKEKRDALIIFYDYEDALLVVKARSEGLLARMYRTTALLFNLPFDATIDEVRNYVSELKYIGEDGKARQPLKSLKDRLGIVIHQTRTSATHSFETIPEGSYAEIKFPDLEYLKEFLNFYNHERFNAFDRCYRLRDIFVPFATEAKRGRYKREVHFEKLFNGLVKSHNSLIVTGCSIPKVISVISKSLTPLLYYGTLENSDKCSFSSTVITPTDINSTARSKALQILMKSNTKSNSPQDDLSPSSGNEDDDCEHENSAHSSHTTILTFCNYEDMDKAKNDLNLDKFRASDIDSSIAEERLGNDKLCLFNPFYLGRDDTMYFINEPAPQQQIQMQTASSPKRMTKNPPKTMNPKQQNRQWNPNNKNQTKYKGNFKYNFPINA